MLRLRLSTALPDPLRIALSEESCPLALTCRAYVTATKGCSTTAHRDGHARLSLRSRDLFLGVLATTCVRGAALVGESSKEALRAMLRSGWSKSPTRDAS